MADRHRLPCSLCVTLWLWCSPLWAAADWQARGYIDVQAVSTRDGSGSWLNGGALGLRHGAGDNGLLLGGAAVEAGVNLAATHKLRFALQAYGGEEAEMAPTEAYWHWRPVPRGRWRRELRVGAFHLPVSLENRGPVWSSPFSVPSSALNTWIGEELRTLGAESRWQSLGRHRGSDWDISLRAALFGFNDTAGALLSWRGWASHDRQAGLASKFPLAALPNLEPGGVFAEQEDRYRPFVEVDNRPGFYLGAELDRRRGQRLSYMYYDNRGDPTALKSGQYAWRTRFHHLGWRWRLAADMELLAQYLWGDTEMGRGVAHNVLNDFWSGYLLLSRRFGGHRLALRWDRFTVRDRDSTVMDTNDEHGRALHLSYSYRWARRWKAAAGYTRWRSRRPGRQYIPGHPGELDTGQWLFSLRRYW